mmetsp:Transcript_5759/g.8853  ORF Transcript_5759/g.8853 Transcript_5759/m.8853 type:complete len:222 (-) Transcript_5759:1267-1932(-)
MSFCSSLALSFRIVFITRFVAVSILNISDANSFCSAAALKSLSIRFFLPFLSAGFSFVGVEVLRARTFACRSSVRSKGGMSTTCFCFPPKRAFGSVLEGPQHMLSTTRRTCMNITGRSAICIRELFFSRLPTIGFTTLPLIRSSCDRTRRPLVCKEDMLSERAHRRKVASWSALSSSFFFFSIADPTLACSPALPLYPAVPRLVGRAMGAGATLTSNPLLI